MSHVVVVDYGMGNLRSVAKALEFVSSEHSVEVSDVPERIAKADKIVFPGQGAMRDCMREIDARGLREAITHAARNKPFLGLCIGLQLLFDHSEEGDTKGLGILSGRVKKFSVETMVNAKGERLKVPHMGWNEVHHHQSHPLWSGIETGTRFYFVHSYYVQPNDSEVIAAYTRYPFEFACAAQQDALFAVQFHPEKSDRAGLKLLSNFLAWTP
jgi:imidazole glycerol-phosphate synthase subunit HisH